MEHKENKYSAPIVIKLEAHKVPEFKEEKNKEWITFGTDVNWYNRYPEYLLSLYNRSIKQNAIVTSKAKYIGGNGFKLVGEYNITQKSVVENLLKQSVNTYGEGLGDLSYKCALDVELFGGCYLEIVWDKKGKDFQVYHMGFNSLRLSKEENGYYFSNDWSKRDQSEEKTGLKFIPLLDPDKPTGSQIYAYKEYRPGLKYYPLPNYEGAITWIEVDYMIANFHHSALKNGFSAGTIINFNNGRPTAEEKAETELKLKQKFTGSDNADSLVLTWNSDKDHAPTIERISSSDVHTHVSTLNRESVIQELIIGHQINSGSIFGVPSPAGLGNERTQMITAYELFKNTYAEPKQRSLNIWFNYLLNIKGIGAKVALKEAPPLSTQLSESALMQIMTKNELRNMQGLKPLAEFEVKIEEPKVSSMVHRFDECTHHEFTEEELDKTISVFRKYGRPAYNYYREKILQYKFSAIELDEDMAQIYRQVLDLIEKEPFITNEQIAELTKREVANIEKLIAKLEEAGAIDTKTQKKYGDKVERRVISDKASEIIDSNPPKKSDFIVMYSYQWRPDVAQKTRANRREFCAVLQDLDRLYSKKDINLISAELGYDVWTRRGGWWNHGDGVNTPYCRHVWAAEYVKEK